MECLIGGAFLALLFLGFLAWLASIIQAKQTEGQPARRTHHPKYESPSGGRERVVDYTPRQKATAQRIKTSERAIAGARKQALKGTPRGTVAYERIRPVSYEGKMVNAICLNDKGEITGYVDLGEMPLGWE